MNVSWDNPAKTYVRVETDGTVLQIPVDDDHPDWRRIRAMVEAGELTVQPCEPPAPAQT